ncbi:hypothetical protein [Rhizobium sp. X9]|uniref:hypothetical protein n=1 Tax=Rhizobium sp. X9 TaxID=2815360 RepID=UPI001C0E6D8F|nr:hypothetical protein [Rhizobium sp. X9]
MVDHSKEFTKILSAGVRPELLVGNGINRDLLDLTRPKDDRSALQSDFCELMRGWKPAEHHRTIVRWAQKHRVPLLTVNFDENLSASSVQSCIAPSRNSRSTIREDLISLTGRLEIHVMNLRSGTHTG